MSDHLRELAQPHDTEATTAMVDSIKAFFTGTLKTRGRRTDLDRDVFYAAAVIVPKGLRENKQMRAVMRLTGLRHDALSKAIQFRSEMGDLGRGWKLLKTARHLDAVVYSPLDQWFRYSAAPSTTAR